MTPRLKEEQIKEIADLFQINGVALSIPIINLGLLVAIVAFLGSMSMLFPNQVLANLVREKKNSLIFFLKKIFFFL